MSTKSLMLFSEYDNSKLFFTELEENQRTKGQRIAYPRYGPDEINPSIQLPWITMDCMGIPNISEYYPDDSKRDFVKVPLNQEDLELKKATELLQALDEKLGSEEMKNKLFGDKANKYDYQPIIRNYEEQETKKESKYKRPNYPFYMKIKLDTEYQTSKLKTKVFLSEMKNQERVRTKMELTTIDELSKQLWLNKVRPVVRIAKLWAQPPNKKGASYGLTFKLERLEVEPSKRMAKQEVSDDFLDSDEEVKTPVKTKQVEVPKAPVKQVESDDSDEESEDEPPKKVVYNKESDSEDEPPKKVVSKVIESDSEDEKPKKAVKKVVGKKK